MLYDEIPTWRENDQICVRVSEQEFEEIGQNNFVDFLWIKGFDIKRGFGIRESLESAHFIFTGWPRNAKGN